MKVAHVTTAAMSGEIQNGGAERAVAELSSALADEFGWDETVVAPAEYFADRRLSPRVTRRPITLDAFSLRSALSPRGPLVQALKASDPDVVVAHGLRASILAPCLARMHTRARVVAVLHNSLHDHDDVPGQPPVRAPMSTRAFRMVGRHAVDAHVVISGPNEDDLIRKDSIPPELIHLIPNWVSERFDLEQARSARGECRVELGLKPTDRVIGVIGRMEEQKNQRMIIELLPSIPDAKLMLVGSGKLRDEYQSLADRLGVSDRVLMPGFSIDPARVMASADVIAMPSVFEGFGRVAIEALAVGTPLVASDLETLREVLKDAPNSAFTLLPLTDRAGWRKSLSGFLDRQITNDERCGMAAFVVNNYSLELAVTRYDRLFREILGQSAAD
ncbi:MAG: glycosyltransferase [Thermoleophilaceae bacterium]|nr:glycosyltransferase [Thermoleophilaceae bacterium]